jgi:hypothetical protein
LAPITPTKKIQKIKKAALSPKKDLEKQKSAKDPLISLMNKNKALKSRAVCKEKKVITISIFNSNRIKASCSHTPNSLSLTSSRIKNVQLCLIAVKHRIKNLISTQTKNHNKIFMLRLPIRTRSSFKSRLIEDILLKIMNNSSMTPFHRFL